MTRLSFSTEPAATGYSANDPNFLNDLDTQGPITDYGTTPGRGPSAMSGIGIGAGGISATALGSCD